MMPGGACGSMMGCVESSEQVHDISGARHVRPGSLSLVDVAVGRGVGTVARPAVRVALRPPLLAPRYQPGSVLAGVARRGAQRRAQALREATALLDVLVPLVTTELLRRLDLTGIVERYVDLDRLVSRVDVDAVAQRLDVDAVAQRLDLDAVVRRLDLTGIVERYVDLDRLVSRVDLDAIARRLDLDAVVRRLDLMRIVRERVDLDALVATVDLDAAARRLDVDAVIDRIDLVGIAETVIAEVDLPEIIRESTGAVASDTVRGVRMQGISGDEAVGRAVDRLRLRRRRPEAEPPAVTVPGGDGIPRQPGPGVTGGP